MDTMYSSPNLTFTMPVFHMIVFSWSGLIPQWQEISASWHVMCKCPTEESDKSKEDLETLSFLESPYSLILPYIIYSIYECIQPSGIYV